MENNNNYTQPFSWEIYGQPTSNSMYSMGAMAGGMNQSNGMGQMPGMGQMSAMSQMPGMGQMPEMSQMSAMSQMPGMGQMSAMGQPGGMSQMDVMSQMGQMGQMGQVGQMEQLPLGYQGYGASSSSYANKNWMPKSSSYSADPYQNMSSYSSSQSYKIESRNGLNTPMDNRNMRSSGGFSTYTSLPGMGEMEPSMSRRQQPHWQ